MRKLGFTVLLLLISLFIVCAFCLTGCDTDDTEITTDNTSNEETITSITDTDTEAQTTIAAQSTEAAATSSAPETTAPVEDNWVKAIYGGGPFVTQIVQNSLLLKRSGYNTVMIWAVHVQENGDLYLNDVAVCKAGEFVGRSTWANAWKSLKQGETSVTRVELSIGAWGCKDFENIKTLIEKDGNGADTMLAKNFKALIDATDADAVNYDDESCYDKNSMVLFSNMCIDMGMKITLCPYTNMTFWKSVKNSLGDNVDRIYLQCYDGGAGNDPATWTRNLGMKVIPGYWCLHGGSGTTAAQVTQNLESKSPYITGGFMWLYDDMRGLASPNNTKQYADAIEAARPEK